MELFRPISGFENYLISTNGIVFSLESNKTIPPFKNSNGYLIVVLSKNDKHYMKRVHRLVAAAFIDNFDEKTDVDHIDGDRTNNNVNNLRIATRQQNRYNCNANQRNNTTGYRGVFKQGTKYKAAICYNKQLNYLGTYQTPEEASRVVENWCSQHHGSYYKNPNNYWVFQKLPFAKCDESPNDSSSESD
jgi:hypothetical protein